MNPADDWKPTVSQDDSSDALPPGTALLNGQYVIDRYLSSGGFGITYHARDSLDRKVVIKECYPEALCRRKAKTVLARSSVGVSEFQSLVQMFVREARSIAKLNNPNIVGVHQVFEDNETAYMALDLIEGKDLLCVVEESRDSLTPEVVEAILRKLLTAVSTVHAVDMLHRDISPDNILLDQWGNPVLIDFGAAREHASKKSRAISAMLVVKDGYSPQEFYISGSKQGPWSDLYSLAATFFHLISGEPPPNSQNRLAALASKRPDPYIPLEGRIEGYTRAFLRAIDKTMNVFPQDRLQSATEWLELIDNNVSSVGRNRKASIDASLVQVVANLVGEVEQGLERDRETIHDDTLVEPIEKPQPVSKVLEYLPPVDVAVTAAPPATSIEPVLWLDRLKKRDAIRQRKRRAQRLVRRSSVLVMICAVVFAILENPPSNFDLIASPDIGEFIDRGRDWTDRTVDRLTIQL
ncbi:serine/threonine-protein kinase [Flavimaricola marinus]|uniref:non-specific serine/threonine protein kinase n=1 Tax=Flavimaricola marinus TaxID=1819565 RepID=A0A238LD03_9RHOB|nr:serine/threonine-protein kinase [Flavimaricola marinus]SMY07294.1 Serine/threonine-protein kinase PknL [Flavimaricola marinus]